MLKFINLVACANLINEARVSPYQKYGFGATTQFSNAGLSSAPYDTIKFIATFLNSLNIFSDEELATVIRAPKFSGKKQALLDMLSLKSNEIVAARDIIEEKMPEEMENYISRVTLNRGKDETGRQEKYGNQAKERADKQALAKSMKKQKAALKQQVDVSNEPELSSAYDVIDDSLSASEMKLLQVLPNEAGGTELDFDDVDIRLSADINNREGLVQKLVNFFNKQKDYRAEATRQGVNVEVPVGALGADEDHISDMIFGLISKAMPDVREQQVSIILNTSGGSQPEEAEEFSSDDNQQGGEGSSNELDSHAEQLSGYGFKPAPVDTLQYSPAKNIVTLYGIPMRAGKWADIFVGEYGDQQNRFFVRDDDGIIAYAAIGALLKHIKNLTVAPEEDEQTSYTSNYMTEQVRKDKLRAPRSQSPSVMTKDRFKPSNIHQLMEQNPYKY